MGTRENNHREGDEGELEGLGLFNSWRGEKEVGKVSGSLRPQCGLKEVGGMRPSAGMVLHSCFRHSQALPRAAPLEAWPLPMHHVLRVQWLDHGNPTLQKI